MPSLRLAHVAANALATKQPPGAKGAAQRRRRKRVNRVAGISVPLTPQLEQILDQVCKQWGVTDRQEVMERLVHQGVQNGIFSMTGRKRGPMLVVDNTTEKGQPE
ncbi:hypothetical protein ACFIQG_10275 [Comamonas odontotermitis]|uniref:hypothetical protein n=1 Tax=Comamonas odontotermitis TaxID=379895 RepID=UPI0036717970